MRIIAGQHKGRQLKSFKGTDIRPTSDRVREAIFNVLGESIADSTVLDLFCGTGALGIEALSRGAKSVVFVDSSSRAVDIVKSNLEMIDCLSKTKIIKSDAVRYLRRKATEQEQFDIIFCDPPYRDDVYGSVLDIISTNSVLSPHGVLVLEFAVSKEMGIVPEGIELIKTKIYGDTKVSFLCRCK